MAQPPYDPYGYGHADPYQQPASVQHHYYGSGPPQTPPNNGMAIVSLILGCLGILSCGFFIFSLGAVIFGHVAQSQIRRTGEQGNGMAVAGLVMGYITILLGLIYWIVIVGIYGAALWSIGNTSTY